MSRETLKEFLANVKGSSADSISFGNLSDENASRTVDRGDDIGVDPNTGEQLIQLSKADIGILGDYVNYIATKYRGGNTFPIAGGNKPSEDINRGSFIQDAELTNDAEVFAKQSSTLGQTLGNYSTSGIFEGTDELVDKTALDKDLDGHSLLKIKGEKIDKTGQVDIQRRSVGVSPHEMKLKSLTYSMLQSNNRFAPGSRGTQYSKSQTESNNKIDKKEIAKSQNSFGENKNDGESFIQKKLKSIGPSMLLKAAGLDIETMDPDAFSGPSLRDNIPMSTISRDLEAGNAFNSPVNRDERGAFDNSSAQTATTVHTVPGFEFQGGGDKLDRKILSAFNQLLSDELAENAKKERENESVYTTNSYFDSVERFLDATIRDGDLTKEDRAYFASMARSVLRDPDTSKQTEKINKFLDVFAVLGDTDLVLYKDVKGKKNKRMWDVDSLKDGPATRISKSRSKNGFNEKSLAWRTESMPSMYHMPMSILRSVQRTGSVSKKNPVKAMLGSSLGDKTYLAQNLSDPMKAVDAVGNAINEMVGAETKTLEDSTRARIPKAMVDIYEDKLDAEYVPFYFHDLRTNEVVAFHAFLSSLSDSFTANHTSYEGYGRMDDVQIYKNTKRTISGKFTLAATSKEDFDEMWYKVNKLVEMLYPQWSSGDLLSLNKGKGEANSSFVRPFSQVPAVSPMIRLRIGDVIRGNYSRFNLGRLFGSGNVNTYINAQSVTPTSVGSLLASWGGKFDHVNSGANLINEAAIQVFMVAFGTPLQFLDLLDLADGLAPDALLGEVKRLAFQALSSILANGFVNPLVFKGINKLKDPDLDSDYGPSRNNHVLIKPSNGKFLKSAENNGKPIVIDRFLKAKITNIFPKNEKTHYNVTIIDILSKHYEEIYEVAFEDIVVDPDFMFENYFAWFLDPVNNAIDLAQDLLNDAAADAGLMGESLDLYTTTFEDFMSPYNNTITKSFEESAGRGLAGFIGKLSYDLVSEKINWEVEHGSRAPMLLEISFDFKPVHDIAPGLDSDGFSRAPVYNVGSIVNNIAGDQQGEGLGSKNRYNKAANKAVKKQK